MLAIVQSQVAGTYGFMTSVNGQFEKPLLESPLLPLTIVKDSKEVGREKYSDRTGNRTRAFTRSKKFVRKMKKKSYNLED